MQLEPLLEVFGTIFFFCDEIVDHFFIKLHTLHEAELHTALRSVEVEDIDGEPFKIRRSALQSDGDFDDFFIAHQTENDGDAGPFGADFGG